MKVGNSLWTNKIKRKGNSKINQQIKCNMYTWITHHTQFVQSPISKYCLKVLLDDQTEPQLFPKFLLHLSIRELHNSLVSDPNYVGLKDARDEDGKIIISGSKLHSLLPPQLKQMSARYKVMRHCEFFFSDKSIYSSFLYWRDRYFFKNEGLKPKFSNQKVW